MKKWYVLSILFLSFSFVHAQHVAYDLNSNWFWGLNAGVTWNTNDVKNVNSSGYGLTLGRSFNYDYGKRISFDLRGRFLTGSWVGQDIDTFSLNNYAGGPLTMYHLDSSSVYVNNFQTDVKRLSMELVLHLNSVHERSGFDPYIFGGIGLTWTQTYGDLLNGLDSSALYDYASLLQNGPISPQLSSTLDGIYETRLDGGANNSYNVKWMPSLGFGLGYQIGKRVSIGIEHKTTFTKGDSFDGYMSTLPRSKNDWYHYTSGYLQIHFKSRGNRPVSENNVNNVSNYTTNTNCPKPVVTVVSGNNKTVTNSQYRMEFKVTNLLSSAGVTLLNDLNQPVLFNYNASTQVIDAIVQLHLGKNTFYLTANNNCGTETATLIVNYVNCIIPTAQFTSPSSGSITVKTSDFAFSAVIQGSVNASNITLQMNGMALNGATYNPTNGLLQRAITLIPGVNTIQLTVSNDCGTNTYTTTIQYDNCIIPAVQLLNPSASGTTTNVAAFTLNASISGSLTDAKLIVSQNGIQLPNISIQSNGQIQLPVTLSPGLNTFNLTVSNGCGSDTEITTINFQNCVAPAITIQSPTQNQSYTSTSNALRLKAIVSNISSKQNIKIIVNGIEQTNFTYNATTGAIELGLSPINGSNSITITATNNCGSDVETIQFTNINCTGQTPIVSILSTGGTTTTAIYNLFASTNSATNPLSAQTISVTQNGAPIAFTQAAGQINAVTTLQPGVNTFVVTAASISCGSDTKTLTVNYNNCIAPQITLIQPSSTGGTTNLSTLLFKANASNIAQSQNIQLVKNGQQVPFTFVNGLIEASITLSSGINTITLSVSNACGNDAETISVNYVQCTPPTIQLNASILSGATVTNASYPFNATILGAGVQNISLKLNGTATLFSNQNGAVVANLTLSPGVNTIILNASNDCGADVETITVNFDNCQIPAISNASNNTASIVASANASQTITATIANATVQNIIFTQNGIQRPFTFTNGQFSSIVNLTTGANSFVLTVSNNCGSDQHNWNMSYTPCTAPTVTIVSPSNSGMTVNSSSLNLQASLLNISGPQEILLSLNGNTISNYTYSNGNLNATLNLQNGLNTLVLKGTNACGMDIKTMTVFYNNCLAPTISVSSPSVTTNSVSNSTFTYTATVQNSTNAQGILLSLNGTAITNFTLVNGVLSAQVNLAPGNNTFVLSVTNDCGTDMKTSTLTYLNCTAPSVEITNPSNNSTSTTSSNFNFLGSVQHMSSSQGISLTLNGVLLSNFNYSNGQISTSVNLLAGINTFVLSAVNACGNDSKTITITYTPCTTPTVSITNPGLSIISVNNQQYAFSGSVQNVSAQQISLTHNGSPITNFSYANGNVSANISLSNGNNELMLKAVNACGTDFKTCTIKYEPCVAPQVSITNPNSSSSSVTNASYSFSGNIENIGAIGNGQGISLTLNGNIIPNASYVNGQITAILNLTSGVNQIVLSAVNNCGSDSQTITVNYNPCIPPVITISNPMDLFFGVNSPIFAFQASVQNMANAQGINLSVSGNPVNNFSFNNGILSATLNLPEGVNTIILSATNECGTASQSRTIRYESCLIPEINNTTDLGSGSTVTFNNVIYTATVVNYAPSTVLQLLVNGVEQTSFTNSNGVISAALNLSPGNNDIQLTATSACGSDTELYNLNFVEGGQNNGPGNAGGMNQQNQTPIQNKTNSPQPTPQNKPVQPTPTPTKPTQPTTNKPTVNPTQTPSKPTQPTTPTTTKPTVNPTQTPTKPTQPTKPEPTKPTTGGGTTTTPTQQTPQNPPKTENPKGSSNEKGGGK